MSKQKSNKADCKKIYFKGYGQPEGSVTVEAAVIIPIMLAFIYLVASFGLFSADLSQKYTQTVRLAEKTSVAAYLVNNGESDVISIPGAAGYRKDFFGKKLNKLSIFTVSARAYTGRSLLSAGDSSASEDDRKVFVAENATVFHVSESCTHLKLSIKQANMSDIKSLRNYDGGKYKPCEICGKRGYESIVFITNEGDRYHSEIRCSGLKRTVSSITESEAKSRGLGPCSRCGK